MASSATLNILVTGSNQGIGLAAVSLLAAAGHTVLMTSRDLTRGQAALDGLPASSQPHVSLIQLDVTDPDSIAELGPAVSHALSGSRLDVLVNNAGLAFKGSTFGPDQAAATLDVNLFGTNAVTHAVLPLMAQPGRIINVCSRAGTIAQTAAPLTDALTDPALSWDTLESLARAFPRAIADGSHKAAGYSDSMYGMSKVFEIAYSLTVLPAQLAQLGHTDPAADDTAKASGLRVYAMCPGYVATNMSSYRGTKTPEQGADTIVWLATELPPPPSPAFYAERTSIPWDASLS